MSAGAHTRGSEREQNKNTPPADRSLDDETKAAFPSCGWRFVPRRRADYRGKKEMQGRESERNRGSEGEGRGVKYED